MTLVGSESLLLLAVGIVVDRVNRNQIAKILGTGCAGSTDRCVCLG